MAILTISPNHFRNLKAAEIVFDPRMNIVLGDNASGKTSLLEAIYFLQTAKSFRSHRIENIVSSHSKEDNFVLFGKIGLDNFLGQRYHAVGVRKSITGKSLIKVDEQIIRSASELVKISPVVVIDPNSFNLLVGGPGLRRKFIDWGVFHVEHMFSKHWSEYNYCLKQRNTLLRAGKLDRLQMKVWDARLAELGETIHQYRCNYSSQLKPILEKMTRSFCLDDQLCISYTRGWDKDLGLEQVLAKFADRDRERRYTQFGPHRADLRLTVNGTPVQDILSRGQQKLLIVAMYLSQIEHLKQKAERSSVVLIDDVAAELDRGNLTRVFSKLAELSAQVICTALDLKDVQIPSEDMQTYKVFHVEHGKIETRQ